jgi:L-threonylcarbamoyladenylate synthase
LLAKDEAEFVRLQTSQQAGGERVGVLLPEGWPLVGAGMIVYPWAGMSEPQAQAHTLFAALRALDDMGAAVIVCPVPEATGIGSAMVDRLTKAAKS